MKLLERPAVHCALIALLGLLAYSNTFHVPFQWDDNRYITGNPVVKDFSYFLEPPRIQSFESYNSFKTRCVGFITFAINYKLHGFNKAGFHIANLLIHIFSAFLVFYLIVLTFRTPFLIGSPLAADAGHIAFFSSLLFVVHPVQTESVTYIYQRVTSLAALFCLGSIIFYVKWRLSPPFKGKGGGWLFYILSLLLTLLAMKTKENAFTLPLLITLYEFMFLGGKHVKPLPGRILPLVPFAVIALIIPLGVVEPGRPLISAVVDATKMNNAIPRKAYLLTQLSVIPTYLRLLFLPVGQNLDYDYPIVDSFIGSRAIVSASILLVLFIASIYLYLQSRRAEPAFRVISFGVLWFFISLLVESSAIALPDVIFEHRIYLPSAGIFLAAVSAGFLLTRKSGNKTLQTTILVFFYCVSLLLSYASHRRNEVWNTETGLWEDVIKKSPNKERGHYNLGLAYKARGLTDRAVEQYRLALDINPYNENTHYNIGLAYIEAGMIDKAIKHFQSALLLKPEDDTYNNLGIAFHKKGLMALAIRHFKNAISANPGNALAHYNLGICYSQSGLKDDAIREFEIAARIDPTIPQVLTHGFTCPRF